MARYIPFYVGKGKGNRWLHHERNTDLKNLLKNEVIEQTWVILEEIPKIKLAEALTESAAFKLEKILIRAIGRRDLGTGPLVNISDGGDGSSNLGAISQKLIGNNTKYHVSKKTPQERRELARKGIVARTATGYKHSQETKDKISAANTGKHHTPESRLKMSLAPRLPMTQETKDKLSKISTGKGRGPLSEEQ